MQQSKESLTVNSNWVIKLINMYLTSNSDILDSLQDFIKYLENKDNANLEL